MSLVTYNVEVSGRSHLDTKRINEMTDLNKTEQEPVSGLSDLTVKLGGVDMINAWLMTAAAVMVFLGAMFVHGNWIAAYFAFTGAWFAWGVYLAKKQPNV
jgi:hypothetical protein